MGPLSICRPCFLSFLRSSRQCGRPSLLSARAFYSTDGKPPPKPPRLAGTSKSSSKSEFKYDAEKVQNEFASLLDEFGLADVPEDTHHDSFTINEMGIIEVTDWKKINQKHKTALVLSPAPMSLSMRDFQRFVNTSMHIKGWRGGGLEEGISRRSFKHILYISCLETNYWRPVVIPMRHRDLRRQEQWILIFPTPADAHKFQQRATKMRDLARRSMPTSPTSGIQPPPDFTSPDTKGLTVRDYTLGPPWLASNLFAHAHPFPERVQSAIDVHRAIVSSSQKNWLVFPVRVWVDQQHQLALEPEVLKYIVQQDTVNRGFRWDLAHSEDAITRMTGKLRHKLLDNDADLRADLGPEPKDSLRVLFKTESEARRFVRAWHRTPVPHYIALDVRRVYNRPLIKAECLFHTDGY